MAIDALIVSRDPDVINVFRNVMEDAGISIHESDAAGDSLQRLATQRFDAVVVDCDGVPNGTDVIEALRKGRSNKTSIAFAVLGKDAKDSKVVSEVGATFVLHKPVSTETALRSMKACHGLILRERRRYLRHAVETHAHLQLTKMGEIQVPVTDISEGGAAINLPDREPLSGEGTMRLILPESKDMLAGKMEVMWCKPSGEAGIRFAQLTKESRQSLLDWLNTRAVVAGLARDFKMAKRKTSF